jgi:hypothetical protein
MSSSVSAVDTERRMISRVPAVVTSRGTQTRDHLFKEFTEWREQQRTHWAEVSKETGRWRSRWKIRDLLADEMKQGGT